MNEKLCQYLDDLACRIDENQESGLHQTWDDFLDNKLTEGCFKPNKRKPSPSQLDWLPVPVNDTLHDPQLMVYEQFRTISDELAKGGNALLNVRCNYGVSIMTSQLGCKVIEMPVGQDNTPTAQALPDEYAIQAVIDAGLPDLRAGQGADVWDTADLFLQIMDRWPVLGRWVSLYHPDTQGPMDNAELAWGSEIFLAFYDSPQRVHDFLELMTQHYIAFLTKWFALVPTPNFSTHWGLKVPGKIVLRDDSLMNLSPEIYAEFIRDYEVRCLRELGGGMIHFCGRGDHFIEQMSQMQSDGLNAINMSQPHLNDMETIYRNTVDKGVKIIGFDTDWANKAITAGRDLHGKVACPYW